MISPCLINGELSDCYLFNFLESNIELQNVFVLLLLLSVRFVS